MGGGGGGSVVVAAVVERERGRLHVVGDGEGGREDGAEEWSALELPREAFHLPSYRRALHVRALSNDGRRQALLMSVWADGRVEWHFGHHHVRRLCCGAHGKPRAGRR